jgi:hypothetical protein
VFSQQVLSEDALQLEHLRALVLAYTPDDDVRRAAVVGNAPLTADPARASAVDGCDLVVRCNSFVLDEPGASFSGRRADLVVLNEATRITRSVFAGYSARLYLRARPGAVYRRKPTVPMPLVELWPDDLGAVDVPNRAVVAGLREELRRRDPEAGPDDLVVPTTGMLAAWLVRLLFPDARLVLTGFSTLTTGVGEAWHHHGRTDAGPVPVSPLHKVDAEGELLRSWIAAGTAELLA